MEISEFLEKLENVKGQGTQFTAKCPAHEDRHNSLSVGLGVDGRILLHCHAGCDLQEILSFMSLTTGDLFPQRDGVDGGLSALSGRGELPHLAPGSVPAKPKQQEPSREETVPAPVLTEDSVYPYHTKDGSVLFEVVRFVDEQGGKTFRQRRREGEGFRYGLGGLTPVLYRLPELLTAISEKKPVYLCEGEKDADALAALGLPATTAPMGAGKWRAEYTECLHGVYCVYILPDNDKAGRAHALLVASELAAAAIPCKIVDLKELCPSLPRKGDVSDVLLELGGKAAEQFHSYAVSAEQFERTAFLRDAADAAPEYVFDSAASYIAAGFSRDLLRNRRDLGVTTGFPSLDRQLDGHLYPGLYVIGSVSSLGKTAFCLQMADHIASTGRDVLFFTLEMPRMEMVARSITRQLFVTSGFRSDYNVGHVLYGRAGELEIEAAASIYAKKSGGHIAFIEGGFTLGADDIVSRASRHLTTTGVRPVIFVDYLQILKSPDVRMSDKQAVDHSVITLKRLSRELDIPIVAVSSFNRQNYSEEVNMAAFKESGAIEYSADFVLGLQARGISERTDGSVDDKKIARLVAGETKKAKQQDPRELEAVILKNRRGPSWARFDLDFYPRQNYFAETGR